MMASVLRRGGTVFDLTEIEHAYAPPYSSAKDPVSIAGYVAENIVTGRSRHLQWHELLEKDSSSLFLLDVRTREEYALGTIEGAVNIPHYEVRGRLSEIPRDKPVVVFCADGHRGILPNGCPSERLDRRPEPFVGAQDLLLSTRKRATRTFSKTISSARRRISQADPGGRSIAPARPGQNTRWTPPQQRPGPTMKSRRRRKRPPSGTHLKCSTGLRRDLKSGAP
jgi:hypothetical protein